MALVEWMGRPRRVDEGLHSIKLDGSERYARLLTAFSATGWHSFIRGGAPTYGWATGMHYRTVTRPKYMDVNMTASIGITDGTVAQRPRSQYRKAQPAKKTYALSQALRNSAQAIAAKRG